MTRRDAAVIAATLTVVWIVQAWGWETLFAIGVAGVGIGAAWSVWFTPERGPEGDRRYAQEHRA